VSHITLRIIIILMEAIKNFIVSPRVSIRFLIARLTLWDIVALSSQ